MMSSKSTVWLCCGEFKICDDNEGAISYAASLMNGDGHSVLAVEGVSGEDLMTQAEQLARRRTNEWLEQQKSSPKSIGYLEVQRADGVWHGREWIYSEFKKDQDYADLIEVYGHERVRFVPVEDK